MKRNAARMPGVQGYAYVLMLAFVGVAGLGLAGVATVWSTAAQREREAELLFVGQQFRAAIASYYEQSPGAKQFPRTLDDLLEDPRFPVPRRHLRRMYLDPMTGNPDWVEVRFQDWVIGVRSRSEAQPVKTALFQPEDIKLAGSLRYADWQFVYTPPGYQSSALAAVQGAADARPPPMTLTGEIALQSTPQAPERPPDRTRMQVPTEPWVCTATLGAELRDCQRTAQGQAAIDTCKQAAQSRGKACLGRAQRAGKQGVDPALEPLVATP